MCSCLSSACAGKNIKVSDWGDGKKKREDYASVNHMKVVFFEAWKSLISCQQALQSDITPKKILHEHIIYIMM